MFKKKIRLIKIVNKGVQKLLKCKFLAKKNFRLKNPRETKFSLKLSQEDTLDNGLCS